LKISPNDSPKLRETLDHVTVRFCGPEAPMDKYWKYCRDAETRELTGKGSGIYNDGDDYENNIDERDYYGIREARRQEKIAMYAQQTKIIRDSAENLLRGARIVRATACKAQRDLLVRRKRPSLQVSLITSSMNAGAAPTLAMFASLASDVGRELLVEIRARDEIVRDAKRADGIYEEENDDGDEGNDEEGDGEDVLYDENESINGALLQKNSFVPSDAETRAVLATKDGAIAILLETLEASLEIVLLHAKASRLEDSGASSSYAEKKDANLLSASRRHHNVLNNVLVRESHEYVRTSAFSRHDIEQLSQLSSAALASIDKATKKRHKYIFSSNARAFLRAKRLAENVKVVLSVTSEMRSILQQQQHQSRGVGASAMNTTRMW